MTTENPIHQMIRSDQGAVSRTLIQGVSRSDPDAGSEFNNVVEQLSGQDHVGNAISVTELSENPEKQVVSQAEVPPETDLIDVSPGNAGARDDILSEDNLAVETDHSDIAQLEPAELLEAFVSDASRPAPFNFGHTEEHSALSPPQSAPAGLNSDLQSQSSPKDVSRHSENRLTATKFAGEQIGVLTEDAPSRHDPSGANVLLSKSAEAREMAGSSQYSAENKTFLTRWGTEGGLRKETQKHFAPTRGTLNTFDTSQPAAPSSDHETETGVGAIARDNRRMDFGPSEIRTMQHNSPVVHSSGSHEPLPKNAAFLSHSSNPQIDTADPVEVATSGLSDRVVFPMRDSRSKSFLGGRLDDPQLATPVLKNAVATDRSYMPTSTAIPPALATPNLTTLQSGDIDLEGGVFDIRDVELVPEQEGDWKNLPLLRHDSVGLGKPFVGSQIRPEMLTPSRQLAYAIRQAGTGSTEITLAPEELGRVGFSVHSHEGAAVISIWADRPETLQMLKRFSGDLVADLQEQGFSEADITFASGREQGRHQQGFNDEAPSRSSNSRKTDAPAESRDQIVNASARSALNHTGQIDLRF